MRRRDLPGSDPANLDAAEAWVIDDRDAGRLAILGRAELPVGGELHPPKRIFFVTAKELAEVPSRRAIPGVDGCCRRGTLRLSRSKAPGTQATAEN